MGFFAFLKAKQMKSGSEALVVSTATTSSSNKSMFEENASVFRVFKFAELRSATNDFNQTLVIGEGGFGRVYKGFLKPLDEKSSRITVAVKTLRETSCQGRKEWLAEVQLLGVLEHPNVVKLVGYCSDDDRCILVYEYMPNKSLEYHLFNRASPPLPFNARLKIALGAAEGLAYLHEGLELQVIHRDFKPSNVLLDGDFNPKLSDFGLAREGPAGDKTYVSTVVIGTVGYAEPEYMKTGHLSTKSDVWSFGVVLYQLLTGRHYFEKNNPMNEECLLDWIKQYPIESKRFNMILDPRLRYNYSMKSVREVAKLANRCLLMETKERPKMSEVVRELKQVVEMTEMASTRKVERKRPKSSSS